MITVKFDRDHEGKTKRPGLMFKHNLLIIFRSFLRFKTTFVINLVGLTTALATAILMFLWINDELSFDNYHNNVDRIFQVMENVKQDGTINTSGHTADFLSTALAEEMPEVEYATVVTPPNFFPSFTLSANNTPIKGVGKFADKQFFKIFSYQFINGNVSNILKNKTDVAISESVAKSLFATTDCIGKTIECKVMGIHKQAIVSGVFKDLPQNSSERFDFVLPFDVFRDIMGMKGSETNWDNAAPFFSYVMIREGTDSNTLNEKLKGFLAEKSKNSNRTLFLKSYADNYLHGKYENGKEAGGRIEYVVLFSVIAIFILVIACINFMNLSTAQAFRKIKNTGVKRIIGAQRKTIVSQYLGEALVITILSVCLAVVVVNLLLPQFNDLMEKQLELVFNTKICLSLTALILVTSILSGAYPALYLSKFDPAKVLKGQFNSALGELWARKGLVVFQFVLSVIFIVSVLVVYHQMEYIQKKNLGYDKENVVYFEVDGKATQNSEAFIAELKKIDGVLNASGMLGNIVSKGDGGGGGMPGTIEFNGKVITINDASVNYDLLELLGMQMKEGRTFSRDFKSDADKVIFNEAAIDALGVDNPVGKMVGGAEILGVVKDFHYQSFHEPVKPYSFRLQPQFTTTVMVKVKPGREKHVIAELQRLYTSFNPGYVFNYEFLDKNYQAQYAGEKRVAMLSQYGAGLTILISCLGLFGLVAFTTERKEKEIGIRKVLGAGELNIIVLLSGDFMKMVCVAIAIALPASYFISTYWLDNFAYRVELQWWYFVSAAGTTFLISWLTIAALTIKAARATPVTMLRSE